MKSYLNKLFDFFFFESECLDVDIHSGRLLFGLLISACEQDSAMLLEEPNDPKNWLEGADSVILDEADEVTVAECSTELSSFWNIYSSTITE